MSVTSMSLPQRYKRLLQAMTLAVGIIYTTLVLYQTAYGYPDAQIQPQHITVERSPLNQQLQQQYSIASSTTTTTTTPAGATSPKPNSPAPSQHSTNSQFNQDHHRHHQQKVVQFPINKSNNNVAVQQQQQWRQQRQMSLQPPPPPSPLAVIMAPLAQPQQTTVIIRKDIHSFNFSDIEVSERPSASILNDFEWRSRTGELLHDLSQRAVTATPKPPITELDDIFISVKTTKNYHDTRLGLIIKTWFQLARDQTWFFTDTDDPYYQERTKGHLINTNCSMGHFRKALCCKMSAELDVFLESGKKWFCHFDDDNYVNVPRLVRLLDEYTPTVDWYLGKPSISSPLEIHLDAKNSSTLINKKITFWFATGGAGFCLSRALTLKMLPIAGGGKFISIGDKIRFPDDVTMGFIIEHLLKVPLTVVENFHSHLEPMEFIRQDTFHDQVSFSYARMKNEWNVIKVDGFDLKTDPKRFHSLHCHLFPYFSFCPLR